MQIHELNNFSGTLGAGSYVAVDNGTDTGKVSTAAILANTESEISTLDDRIDNIINSVTVDSEVIDARLGADGVTYATLGTAIRTQFSDVKDDITEITDNTIYHYLRKKYIALNGATANINNLVTSASYETVVVSCSEGDVFYVTAQGQNATRPWGFLSSDGTVLSVADANSSVANLKLTAPASSAYLVSNNQFLNNPNSLLIKNKALKDRVDSLEQTADNQLDINLMLRSHFNTDLKEYTFSPTFEQGGLSSVGDEITSSTRIRTEFIDVSLFGRLDYSASTGYEFYYIYYDKNKTYTGGSSWESSAKSSTISASVKYVRVILRHSVTTDPISPTDGSNLTLVGEWLSRTGSPQNKWYVLGDSISAGYYSMTASMASDAGETLDYNSPVTTEGGEATGSVWDSSLAHNYWGYANKWLLNRTLVGKAYPGQGYYRTASNSQNGVYVVAHNDFSDAGLITVAWGFNDWHYNQPRGDHNLIDDTVPYPTASYDTSQITTVNQAIWFCLGELIRQAPNAKIVVQTPMNGWAYGGDFSTNWSIGYSMSQSDTLKDIHDDIIYWCDYYGLQYIEMTFNNSIVNRRNIKDTLIDGSHPSDAAHKQLGRHVAIALKYC